MDKKWILVFFIFYIGITLGQNPIGIPVVTSYPRDVYNAGLQNRNIAQDKNGILYFANSEGLLSFDGTYWKLYSLPNKTNVRSITIGRDNKIYAGGQNEIGFFSSDKNGKLSYKSLKALLPEKSASFTDVWDIVAYEDEIFFRSQTEIFLYANNSITAYAPASRWLYLGLCAGKLIAQDEEKGLLQFSAGNWSSIETRTSLPANAAITGIQPLSKDSILLVTQKKGLYVLAHQKITPFTFKSANPFLNQQIMCALAINNKRIAIGTHMGGCYIISNDGRIIDNISRREGLQNNTVLGLFLDRDLNLWAGLDDGVDFIAYNSAIKHIYPEKLNEGAGYSAILYGKELYIGTSNWLYRLVTDNTKDLSDQQGEFNHVAGTKGSAWALTKVNNSLLLAHHEGAFQIDNGQISPISTHCGYWNFTDYDNILPSSIIVAGNYNGLDLIKYDGKHFVSQGNNKFAKSSRFITVDNQTAWVAHSYKGVYKVDLNPNSHAEPKLYTVKNGLPSNLSNRVFKVKNHMVVTTEKGLYEYISKNDSFEPSAYFLNIFKQKALRFLKEDIKGNIWFIEEKKLGVVDFSGPQPHIIYFPELNGKLVSDFENVYPLNDQNIFVGAEKGFYHVNFEKYKKDKSILQLLISSVKAIGKNENVMNGGYKSQNPSKKPPEFPDDQNSVRFEYSATAYQLQSNIEYSYHLKGFDKEWSAWSKKTDKDYTNLPAGSLTFEIKARNNLGNESAIVNYSFVILPPWYQTYWAYGIYSILFLAFNYLFYKWLKKKFLRQKRKYEEEQERLKYLHQLEIDKSEKEIFVLKNEMLMSEIEGKNSELAAVAMHLLQKSEVLTKIREELVRLRKTIQDDAPSDELKKLLRILNQETKMDKDWEQFAHYFDNTHGDFLKSIKEEHPSLNAHELKLCAYLRMNLSSKEMAQLMNISVRGVEVSRYRLRKKLRVATDVNIYNYFTEFSTLRKETFD